MKNKLKSSMKPAPERFRYSVTQAVHEAETTAISKKSLSKGWKIAIATALVVALVPSTVFGASKLFNLFAEKEGEHGVSISATNDIKASYPEYVKMNVVIPDGFAEVPNTDGMKYYSLSAEEPYTDGFSIIPMRFPSDKDTKEYIGNVDSYEAVEVAGHQAYALTMNKGWDRLYVYFEDVNVTVLIYNTDVSNEQLTEFVKGISFTEATADDCTYLDTPVSSEKSAEPVGDGENANLEYTSILTAKALDETVSFTGTDADGEDAKYTAKIEDIKITDNINGLDRSSVNDLYNNDKYIADDGTLKPKTTEIMQEGDGFNEKDTLISSEEAKQKLILATVTYTNLSDKDIKVCNPYRLDVFNTDDSGYISYAGDIDKEKNIFTSDYTDTEAFYQSPHGNGLKDYYFTTVPANSRLTVTIGYRCHADMTDKAYLTIDWDSSADGIEAYETYLFKVQ